MRFIKSALLVFLLGILPGALAVASPGPGLTGEDGIFPEPDSTYSRRFKIRSTTFSLPTVKDQFLSPFTYYGVQLGTTGTTLFEGRQSLRIRTFTTQFGALSNEVNESGIISGRFEFDYSYLRLLHESTDRRLKLYAGGMYNALFALRMHTGNVNNVLSHDLATALHASGMLNYKFNFRGRAFTLNNQLSIPVIGVLSRPEYAWSFPYFMWEKDAKAGDNIRVVSFGNYFRLQNRIALDYKKVKTSRKTGRIRENYWRVSYTWDYYQINRPTRMQSANQVLGFGRIFQF